MLPLYPNRFKAQFFLLKVNGNLVICSPPIYTGGLLVTVHNLQQKIQKKEKHGFHLQSMGLSRFLDLFLLQTLSVKSGRDRKNSGQVMKIDPSPTCIKILLYFDGSLSERVKHSKVFLCTWKHLPAWKGPSSIEGDLLPCDMQSFCSSSKRHFILFFTGEVLFPKGPPLVSGFRAWSKLSSILSLLFSWYDGTYIFTAPTCTTTMITTEPCASNVGFLTFHTEI